MEIEKRMEKGERFDDIMKHYTSKAASTSSDTSGTGSSSSHQAQSEGK